MGASAPAVSGQNGVSVIRNHLDAAIANHGYTVLIGEPSMFDKGYGTEATLTTLAYGFERLNMEVIHLGVSASNVRAVRSYEKAGFIQEGVRRNYVYSRGKYHDAVMMSVLRQDYMASKTP